MAAKDEDRTDRLSSRKKRKGKIQYKHNHSNTMDLCPFEILEGDESHAACLDSVCLWFVHGVDMKYFSLNGKASLETLYLPTLNYPQTIIKFEN